MSSDESDLDLLANLLADDDDPEPATNTIEKSQSNTLKELDFNFLDNEISTNFPDETPKVDTSENKKTSSLLANNGNSSDEEDGKYFEKQNYSEYGREIKNLLKNKETENRSSAPTYFNSSSSKINIIPKNNLNVRNNNTSLQNSFDTLVKKDDKYSLQVPVSTESSIQRDVYCDPIFGLRIVKPLVSSAELTERMQGRKPVTISNIKMHLTNQSLGKSSDDWVIAGILISKSASKTSQKGNQYCIWKISDLSMDMKTVSVFLFSSAYKNFWKLSTGVVVGILNPSILESKDDKDLATLSVDNAQKIMILGNSKDLGTCKSLKKNGEPCTAPVNLRVCEYCVYHVKQEYGKYSRRSELQTVGSRRAFGKPVNPFQKTGVSQQRHPEAAPFVSIPAKRNEALYKKDCERLALLNGTAPARDKSLTQVKPETKMKINMCSVDLSAQQAKKDSDRLKKLRQSDTNKTLTSSPLEEKVVIKSNLPLSKLGTDMKGGMIDLSAPIPKHLINKAKQNAIEWVRKNGLINKTNPNRIRPKKEEQVEKGVKRRREEEEGESIAQEDAKKKVIIKTRFQEMLEKRSAHSDLIEKRESEETEQYFNKLEAKERMEEKMLTTFKVECKAVQCSICKYIAFSSSDLCKRLQHPIKVIKAVKRFFKCGDCGNRTISLDRIPTETCSRCSSSKWIKAAMMDDKRTQISGPKLCIRGGEEKFIGSAITDASLNLLVPESE